MNMKLFSARRPNAWLLLAVLSASGCILQAASTESNLNKSFTVKPGGQLILEADRGSIDITTGDRNDLVIEVKRKVTGGSSSKAQEIFAAHQVTFDQDGDRIAVHARLKKEFQQWFNRNQPNLQVEFHISLPKQFDLDLHTALGSIVCGALEGAVKARSDCGSLQFGSIQGSFDGASSLGNIKLVGASGPVAAKTSSGSIQLGRVEADTLAETSLGTITITTAKAKLKATSKSGSLALGELNGPAQAVTSLGSITVKSARASLDAKTSSGSIEVDEARDTVAAETSLGSISVSFSAQPTGDCRLVSSSGGIEVRLPDNVALDVDAKTSSGRVKTELPIAATVVGEHRSGGLKGKLNGGGQALLLKTSLGNINIRRQ